MAALEAQGTRSLGDPMTVRRELAENSFALERGHPIGE